MSRFRFKIHGIGIAPPSGYLEPGAFGPGAWSTTATPDPRGSAADYAYYQNAIAGWDTIPHQDLTGTMEFGVVAFHIPTAADFALGRKRGIEYVEFSIDGGPWLAVYTETVNAQTGTLCFNAPLRASDCSDGQHEIRAIVYPYVGIPRVLQGTVSASLAVYQYSNFINTNYGGTLTTAALYCDSVSGSDTTGDGSIGNPYASIYKTVKVFRALGDVGGKTIYCAAGNYAYQADDTGDANAKSAAATRYLTVRPKAGVAVNDVVITTSGAGYGIRTRKVRLKDIKVTVSNNTTGAIGTRDSDFTDATLWLDNVTYEGAGGRDVDFITSSTNKWFGGIFVTDGDYSSIHFGPVGVTIGRGYTVHNFGSDAFHQGRVIINCTAYDLFQTSGAHPDIWQIFRSGPGEVQNVIFYGVTANVNYDGQLLFFSDSSLHRDVAVVGCDLKDESLDRQSVQNGNALQHLYILDSIIDAPNVSLGTMTDCALGDVTFVDDGQAAGSGLVVYS